MFEELFCRQIARLPPIEDRLSDIGREVAEADEPSEIGPADTFPMSECGKGNAFAEFRRVRRLASRLWETGRAIRTISGGRWSFTGWRAAEFLRSRGSGAGVGTRRPT